LTGELLNPSPLAVGVDFKEDIAVVLRTREVEGRKLESVRTCELQTQGGHLHEEEPDMTSITLTETIRELDARESDGIAVSLLWDTETDAVFIDIVDCLTLEPLRLTVPKDRALDAFHHPFAYAASQGLLDVLDSELFQLHEQPIA
jgi:hypothetical protein